MAPLEPWEKVLIDSETFLQTRHGEMDCTTCHKGEYSADKEAAHTGLISRPSETPEGVCGMCHPQITEIYPNSLHATQAGYWTAINTRSVPEDHPALEEMFDNHCASCHTSCGDCHVSQPASVGGGLIDGHNFNATPSITRNCTACHGSRVGNEYLGKHEGIKADVHFRQGRMKCSDCHDSREMHGDYASFLMVDDPTHRYDGGQVPLCTTCHPIVGSAEDSIEMHTIHGERLSCQVCHSMSYSSCDGCHVQVNEDSGTPYFRTEGTYLTFLVGRNPIKSDERPYDYVPLRHIPISPSSYQYYTGGLLTNYDELPTWVYATPHNIQRETPQNSSCDACHGNPDIFLTADKVADGELAANEPVIIEQIPFPLLEVYEEIEPQPEDHVNYTVAMCLACHLAGGEIPMVPESHDAYPEDSCENCHVKP